MAIYRISNKQVVDTESQKFLTPLFDRLDATKNQIMQANHRSFVLRDHTLAKIDDYKLLANYVLDMIDLVDAQGKRIETFFRV